MSTCSAVSLLRSCSSLYCFLSALNTSPSQSFMPLQTEFLCFTSCKKVLTFHSFLKDIFAWYRILHWQILPCQLSSQWLTVRSHIHVSLQVRQALPGCFPDYSHFFNFQTLWYMLAWISLSCLGLAQLLESVGLYLISNLRILAYLCSTFFTSSSFSSTFRRLGMLDVI